MSAGVLTEAEIKLLEKYNKQKEAHKQHQQAYRQKKKQQNPDQYKEDLNKYMREYNQKKKNEINEIKNKVAETITEAPTPQEIKPLEPIKQKIIYNEDEKKQKKKSTKKDYLSKVNIIQKLFKNKDLSQELKDELKKLFNNDDDFNEDLILNEMPYLNNVDEILRTLKSKYKAPNSLKTYINIIVVIAKKIKSLFDIYSQLTKINSDNNNKIQTERNENKLKKEEKDKIISLEITKILNDIKTKLKDPLDILIYGLYTLQPSRRFEYRNMKIIKEPEKYNLDDPETNYLILTSPERFIFNDYKTSKTYGQQTINILYPSLLNIINQYIKIKNIQDGEYLITQPNNKNKLIDQNNFSRLISKVFKKALNINTSLDYIRQSHIINFIDGGKHSNNEKKIFAAYCGHSVEEQGKYYKIL
jgi:hypothetical protein